MTKGPLVMRLHDTLSRVQALARDEFSGIGILVCDYPDRLPIIPISDSEGFRSHGNLISQLAIISSRLSPHHDGFHILSSAWELTHVSQYFSPPIVQTANINRTKQFGGRYLAALFGSALPVVKLSGIASYGFGVAIFREGKEVLHEILK